MTLKDKSKNRKLSKSKKNQAKHYIKKARKSLKKWRSLAKPRRGNGQQKLDLVVFSIFSLKQGF